VDRAKAELKVAESAIESARANLRSADADIKNAEADTDRARVQTEDAKRKMDRLEALYKDGIIAREEMDNAVKASSEQTILLLISREDHPLYIAITP